MKRPDVYAYVYAYLSAYLCSLYAYLCTTKSLLGRQDSDHHEDECVMMRRRLLELEQELKEITGEDVAEAERSS